jgi:predicted Zn-dependent peptidase
MLKKTTLENKLRIITAPMQGTNTVTILVLCETGAENEPGEYYGISHFLEHMFFKGTTRRPTAQIINQEFDSMGGFYNAFTTHEVTGYFSKVGKIYFEQALDILSDIYTDALLKPEEIERERQVIIEERKMRLDDPQTHLWHVWERLLYGDQHAGRDVVGEEAVIRSIPATAFREYFESQYTSQNTIVVVAGNCDESEVIDTVAKRFGGIRSGTPRPRAVFNETGMGPRSMVVTKETDQTHVIVGYRGFSVFDRDRYPVSLLATILGGSAASRMYDSIREQMGLAYAIYSDSTSYANRGSLYAYAGVTHENFPRAVEAITAEYQNIFTRPVAPEELKRAKDLLKGRLLIQLEASNAVAHFVGEEEAMTKQPLTVDEVFAKIDGVSVSDLSRAALRLFQPDRLNLAVIGPHKPEDAAKLINHHAS